MHCVDTQIALTLMHVLKLVAVNNLLFRYPVLHMVNGQEGAALGFHRNYDPNNGRYGASLHHIVNTKSHVSHTHGTVSQRTRYLLVIHTPQELFSIAQLLYIPLFHSGLNFYVAGGPVAMGGAPLLSATWFPAEQRTTATAIAAVMNGVGVSISFIIGENNTAVISNKGSQKTANVRPPPAKWFKKITGKIIVDFVVLYAHSR